jgi:hypothetical protein
VVVLDPPSTVQQWGRRTGADHTIVGGFYMRPGGPALGDLWIAGRATDRRGLRRPRRR